MTTRVSADITRSLGSSRASVREVEAALACRCACGDHEAMTEVYRRFERTVFGVMVRMVGPTDADELTQDAFMRIFRGMRSYRGDSALGTWIYRLAMNVCLSHIAKQKRRRALKDQHETSLPRPRSEYVMPQPFLRTRLEQAMGELPAGYRAVLVLHDVEGLNHCEIAGIMGWRQGTSKSQLHKARMRMRTLLADAR